MNEGRNRFNNDGSRNAYVYSGSNMMVDDRGIQEEINKPLFIIVNAIFYAIALYGCIAAGLDKFIGIPFIAIILGIEFFYLICYELLIKKTGNPWWGIFIPLYNFYLLLKLIFNKPIYSFFIYFVFYFGLAFIIVYLPKTPFADYQIYVKYFYMVAAAFFPLICSYKLGTNFGSSGILMVLLSPIMIPIIAFGSQYEYIYNYRGF